MDRYWVGGTATWDGTAGTKWAATSGGAGGQSVPTSADDVFFDAASGAVTVTLNSVGTYNCRSIICTGFTGTITGSGGGNIFGGLTLSTTMTWSGTAQLLFAATSGSWSIDTAGRTVPAVTFDGAGGTWTLSSALTLSGAITVTRGTFTTNNYAVTATNLSSSNSNVRTINLGSSTVTLSSGSPVGFQTPTNLTLNSGTSTIVLTGVGGTFAGGGQTFYNISSTSTSGINSINFAGANTFNNLTVTGPASAGVKGVTFESSQTINGTLSTTGTAGNRRVWFRSATYGLAQTLTINSAPSLTDADFRDIYVIGTAAPISGTRIGDLRGIRGITASTPKNCFRIGAGNWSDNQWSDTSGGSPSTDFFPLAQDTAVFDESTTGGTHTMNTVIPYTGSVDMSARTSALTLSLGVAQDIYGNWTFGSGITISGNFALSFSGRDTQTITSAGKTFSGGITVDSYGGAVELADALNIGTRTLIVTNGTFDTKNYNVTAGILSSSNSNVRTINLGSSTVTLSSASAAMSMNNGLNLVFNPGTSSIVLTATSSSTPLEVGGVPQLYDVTFTRTTAYSVFVNGAPTTIRNLTITAPASAGITEIKFSSNFVVTGTLTCTGATAVRRIFLRSSLVGTPRTLTVNSLSADDCDFRDITIAGAAAGSSPTRAGDCGGNTGITFPAAKTVYWNLAGTQNWSATGWAPSSGGTPDINQFPLAQDTAVFDDTGSVTGTITINAAWNIGTFDASARTSAMTLNKGTSEVTVYKDWETGTGITYSQQSAALVFSGFGTQTIISSGVTFEFPITIQPFNGSVLLGDALVLPAGRNLTLNGGTFDAVTYNVTANTFTHTGSPATLKMGSGTWTLSGTGTAWNVSTPSSLAFYKGTANIVLSNTSTTARTFDGGSLSYNKLTIGGATGSSTLTINGNNQFTELASTKTVAHTIALGTTTQTFGAWTVTGTAGNVVTLTGTGANHILAGACTDGIDYLAMGSIGFSATSPGEFYAGANSTGTAAAPVYRTAKPADSTRYWVGGTGNWSDTARWSTSSGGSGGASVPRSHDDVVFDSASNATAYTATVNAVTGGIRTKALTIAGPASGNVTLAGSTAINGIHGDVTLPATGLTRTYTGSITLSGSATGRTLTTNGVTFASDIVVNGVGCAWTLGSALNLGASGIGVVNGSIDFATYNVAAGSIGSGVSNSRTINFGNGTVTLSNAGSITFGTTEAARAALTVTASTSQINCSATSPTFSGNNQTFYNVAFTSASAGTVTLNGVNTFNNLSFTGITSSGLKNISVTANQTITDTLSFLAGTNATMRQFVQSNTIGTTRTLTCANFVGTDIDFRDITIAGAAAPVSGTRLGDCKGNSGITFDAAKTVYWRLAASSNWSATTWALSPVGLTADANFPLAQDTAVFNSGASLNSGQTATINAAYNIGTIDMQARTSNTMTLATGAQAPAIYGNWINGTGTTLTGTGTMTFAGRGSQMITSAGRTFTQTFNIDTPGGSVTLQDALTSSFSGSAMIILRGTIDANGYNVTCSNASANINVNNSNVRTVAIGAGTWTVAGSSNVWNATTSTNLTVTGTGTISLTSASAKTFTGGGISYSGITLDQGGAGTLTITGNNTFANISNTYKATGATTIAMGTTTQTVSQFTAAGEAGRVLTVQGSSASSPATLVFTGSGQATTPTTDYLTITGVRAYSLDTTWYAGANSTNNGSLGWYFEAGGGGPISVFIIESATAADAQSNTANITVSMSETTTASDAAAAGLIYIGTLNESATAADVAEAFRAFLADVSESATSSDLLSASLTLAATISELTTATDSAAVTSRVTNPTISEAAQMADVLSGGLLFLSNISEATTASEIAESVLIFNRAVAEATTASEVLAAVAVFQAAVPEQVSGADVANALLTVGGAINEALTALDEAVAANNMTASVGSLGQNMALLPLGTSAAGSLVFDSSSFIDGASVFANGTGVGATGGFALDGNYLGFAYAGPGLYAEAITPNISWLDIVGIRVDLIAGTGSNGGPLPNGDMDVSLVTTAGPFTVYSTIALITKDAATTLISVMIPVSAYYRVASGKLSFQPNSPAPTTTPSWAIKSITIYYGGAGGTDSTTNVYTANPVIAETATPLDATQVVASTFNAASAETAIPLDTPQGANTGSSSLSESATVSDAAATAFVPSTAISESSTAQESVSSLAVLSGPIVEAAALADTTSVAPSVFSAVALAAAQAAESFNPAGSVYNASAAVSVVAVDALRRSKLRVVDIEAFVSTGANVTAMTAEATVTGNTVSGTVESGQITATVLP